MSYPKKISFTVYETEPISRLITCNRFATPLRVAITFLIFGLILLIIAECTNPFDYPWSKHKSYRYNLSWSLSMIFLFPALIGLTLKYYQDIPNLFEYLLENFASNLKEAEFESFVHWVDQKFNNFYVPPIVFTFTLIINVVYFRTILNNKQYKDWMSDGELFEPLLATHSGFTSMGLCAALVQVFLFYWIFNLLWKGICLAWGLHRLLNNPKYSMKLIPLHPDGCCGLKKIGEVSMSLNIIFFLLGIYMSLKVIDKIVIQGLPLDSDFGNPAMLIGYPIVATALFFFPLGAAHNIMKRTKEQFLFPISRQLHELLADLSEKRPINSKIQTTQYFDELFKVRNNLNHSISIWPFNFKSLEAFFGTVVIPLFPVILPFFINHFF